jgi:hypothetical protein
MYVNIFSTHYSIFFISGMASKRKSTFQSEYEKLPGIKKSRKGAEFAHCVTCDVEISLGCMGKAAIYAHQKTTKHTDATKASSSSQALSNFFPSTSAPTALDEKTAAAEGTWAYHVARHHHSFFSTECVSSDGLFRTMFDDSQVAKKFASAPTKTTKIVTRVLAPFSVEKLLQDIGFQPFSLSIDASNHKEIKLFPVIIRFFSSRLGVQVRLLDMQSLPGEDAQLVYDFIVSVVNNNGLDFSNLISFCADNAPVNFGGPQHKGKKNVFKYLKEKTKILIPLGCPAHILHNAAGKAADRLTFDIEAIVLKLGSYFNGSTLRHENLKEFCDFVSVTYATLPTHVPTRWTTLLTVLDRVLHLWDALKSLFSSIDKPPRILEDFFQSDEAHVVCFFLQSALKVFEKPILLLQNSKLLLPELLTIVNGLKAQISERQAARFFGGKTTAPLHLLQLEDSRKSNALENSFLEFYATVLEYIDKWYHLESFPTNISWIMLTTPEVAFKDIQALALQVAPELAEKDDLFDEVTQLNGLLKELPNEIVNSNSAEEKWKKIFKDATYLPCLYRLVSIILAIPASNAFIERIFSLCNAQWTKERNCLNVDTVKSLAQVKTNFDFTCSEMFSHLMSNSILRSKIRSCEKYK